MLRRLDRYIIRETLGPLTLGFVVYTFILLIRFLFVSMEMIIRRGVSAMVVGKLLLSTLPNIIVLSLPTALLFGLLTAVGRLASDSELIAMRSSGIGLTRLYRPVLLLSVLLTLINMPLMMYLVPWSNAILQQLKVEIVSQSVAKQIEPRVFYDEWPSNVLYVFDTAPQTKRWEGVFLAQNRGAGELEVTVADSGQLRVDESGEQVILDLENTESHKVALSNPDRYQRQKLAEAQIVLDEGFASSQRAKLVSNRKGLRELTMDELVTKLGDEEPSAEIRNLTRVEIHKKIAIPFACAVFGLFALPLGFNSRRGGKMLGFVLSIIVIAVYYIILTNGEEAARYGRIPPWAAMWAPNILLTLIGLYLLWRRNKDRGLLFSTVDRWLRTHVWQALDSGRARMSTAVHRARESRNERQAARMASAPEQNRVRLQLLRPRLAFPNLLDRYTLRTFASVFVVVLASVLMLYILADLSEKFDEILKNQVPRALITTYYVLLSAQIFYELAPIVVLVTTLVTFGLLSRSNEVTAAKALGVSLFRLAIPVAVAALVVSLFSGYLQSAVLPISNQNARKIEDRIAGKETRQTYSRPDRWLFGKGGFVYNFLHYDPQTLSLQRLHVFEFGEPHQLKRRLYAANARFDSSLHGGRGGWLFSDGWVRQLDSKVSKEKDYVRFAGPVEVDCKETPEFFASEIRQPDQMGYSELKQYVAELRASGQAVPELEVELHKKVSFPANSFIMALVALPFAFRLGKQGALYGIGVSIALAMTFFAVLALFSALGKAGALSPSIAVWIPGALFTTFSVYLFLGVRT